jgi:hypothetical protein
VQAAIGAGAIAGDAGVRIGLFAEVEETAAREIVEQLVVSGPEGRAMENSRDVQQTQGGSFAVAASGLAFQKWTGS